MDTVSKAWLSCSYPDGAINISTKLKALRAALKSWNGTKSNLRILINHYNIVIAFLDDFEEIRPLHVPERNFRIIIQSHLQKLLHCQHIYWKQRYTEKLVKWGDENTKIFHARATERFRFNVIAQISAEDRRLVSEHAEKAALFWQEFKTRMCVSVNPQMLFELDHLIIQHDLHELVAHFTIEELDVVAKDLPNDKVPGPDVFNGHFFKKSWSLIKYDVYRLCRDFYDHMADLKSINYSYITLVPNKSRKGHRF